MIDHHPTLLHPPVPGTWERWKERGQKGREDGRKERGEDTIKEGRRGWKVWKIDGMIYVGND